MTPRGGVHTTTYLAHRQLCVIPRHGSHYTLLHPDLDGSNRCDPETYSVTKYDNWLDELLFEPVEVPVEGVPSKQPMSKKQKAMRTCVPEEVLEGPSILSLNCYPDHRWFPTASTPHLRLPWL